MAPGASPVRVTLEQDSQTFVIQPGRINAGGWRFDVQKNLATDSQPFDVVALRQVGWAELPWAWMAAWGALVAALLASAFAWLRQRAEELLRLGQVARLDTMGELAAGMAHELNQPLTACWPTPRPPPACWLKNRPSRTPHAAPWRNLPSRRAVHPMWWAACAAPSSGPTAPQS